MGEARQTFGLSDAPRGRAAGRLAARRALKAFWNDESGATAIELGVIVALISVVLIGALTGVSTGLKAAFTKTANAIGS